MAKKSLVALVKGTDIQENVTKVFDLMGGVENAENLIPTADDRLLG